MGRDAGKQKIFQAAIQEFAAGGYRGTSVEQIARAAGASKSNLLFHYRSKQRLFSAVLEHCMSEFEQTQTIDAEGSSYQRASSYLKRTLYWMVENPHFAKIINRTFTENPKWAEQAAKRYWIPMVNRFGELADAQDRPQGDLKTTLLLLFNGIFQIAFSIELQVQLLGPRKDTDELLFRYENEINRILYQYFHSVKA